MKKLILFVPFVICFAFSNAQFDTVIRMNEIIIHPNAIVTDSANEYYDVVGIYDSSFESWPLYSGKTKIVFNASGLDTNDFIVLYLNEWNISHFVIGYDTIYLFDTIFIEHIDTILDKHHGLYFYDTTYVVGIIDTINIFEEPKLEPVFHEGYNEYSISTFVGDSIYIDSISIFVMNENIMDSIRSNTVYINNLYIIIECEDLNINDDNIRLSPNPTSGIIYLDGKYETLTIHDMNGHILAKITDSKVTSFDMSRLKNGEYFFTFDGYHTIKVIKK